MPAATFAVNLAVTFTPPGANVNSGQSSFPTQGTYNAQCAGQLDIPSSTIMGTVFPIPFGSIQAAKLLVIKNMMSTEVGIRINGASVDNFRLASGGELMYAAPSAPTSAPFASASVVTTASPTADEQITFVVLGD